jgi:hypothetical protein
MFVVILQNFFHIIKALSNKLSLFGQEGRSKKSSLGQLTSAEYVYVKNGLEILETWSWSDPT